VGRGCGDWDWGIADWGLGPIPTPQSPIPNPHGELLNLLYNYKIYIYLKDL